MATTKKKWYDDLPKEASLSDKLRTLGINATSNGSTQRAAPRQSTAPRRNTGSNVSTSDQLRSNAAPTNNRRAPGTYDYTQPQYSRPAGPTNQRRQQVSTADILRPPYGGVAGPADPYQVRPANPMSVSDRLRESGNDFASAAVRWQASGERQKTAAEGWVPPENRPGRTWFDYPADMDGADTYRRQLKAGRPALDVQQELARRAKKRAEAFGGMGEYTNITQYMTKGEAALYNTTPMTPLDVTAANVGGVWEQAWHRVKGDWSDYGKAGQGNFFDPNNQEVKAAAQVVESARANNYEIIVRAEQLRAEHYRNLIRSASAGGTMPYVPDGTIGTIDTIPMEPFMEQAERELNRQLTIPQTSPTGVMARNLFDNAMQVPLAGKAANIVGNSLGTALEGFQAAGRTLWAIPHYEQVTGDENLVAMGDMASATVHAIGQASKTAWDVAPWQYTEEVNPIASYNKALASYVQRVVDNVYSFAPNVGQNWNPNDASQQSLLRTRALATAALSFSGVEAQEAALDQLVSREPTITYLERAVQQSLANSMDMSLPQDVRSQEALNAANMQMQLEAVKSANVNDIMDANIDPWRDALLGAATDFTMWYDVARWLGAPLKSISPFARRLDATVDALGATEAQIIKRLEQDGIVQKASRLARPPSSNVAVELREARSLLSYVLGPVTVKADVPTILNAMVANPTEFFTKGVPAGKILSPGLKMYQEGGWIKFPHIASARAAFTGVLKTLGAVDGEFAALPSLTTGNNLLISDVVDDLLTVTEIAAADKYRTGTMPFAVPVGTASADVRMLVNTAGNAVYVVDLKNAKGVNLGRKILPTQKLAEKAAAQVNKAIKTGRYVRQDWVTMLGAFMRSYASGAYLALVPGSNITNAVNGWISTFTAGVANWEPLDNIIQRAEKTFGSVPYEYLVRGSANDYFIRSGLGTLMDKARQIRSGQTTVPLTGGRLSFGENAHKARAWAGGSLRAMDTLYGGLWSKEIRPMLDAAQTSPELASGFKAALSRLSRTWDLDAFSNEIASLTSGRMPTFNPARYGNNFIDVLSQDAIRQIDTVLANGGRPEDVVRLIDAEIAKVGTDITANVAESVPVNATAQALSDAKEAAKIAEDAARTGNPAMQAAANRVTQVIRDNYDNLVTAFSAAVGSQNPNSGALIAELWGRIALAKRESYARLNELAMDIKASGDTARWADEYQEAKIQEWAGYAQQVMTDVQETLGKIARGETPDPAAVPLMRTADAEAPDIAKLGRKSATGPKLEQIIDTHRAYKNFYLEQFFAMASKYGDARTLNVFLTTFGDVARRESVLWAQINEMSRAIDNATTAGQRGKALRLYKDEVAKLHYDFSLWASAKWRAATAYVEYAQTNMLPALAQFTHPQMGRGTIVGISKDGAIVRYASGISATVLPSQLPPEIMRQAEARLTYLTEMEKRISENGYIKLADEPPPTVLGRPIPATNYNNPITLSNGGLMYRENSRWLMRTAGDPEPFPIGDKLASRLLEENGYALGEARQLPALTPPQVNDSGRPPAGAPGRQLNQQEMIQYYETGQVPRAVERPTSMDPVANPLNDAMTAGTGVRLSGGGTLYREGNSWMLANATDPEPFPVGDELANRLLDENGYRFDSVSNAIMPREVPAEAPKRSHHRQRVRPNGGKPIEDMSELEQVLARNLGMMMELDAKTLKVAAAEAPAGAAQIKARQEAKGFVFSKAQIQTFVRGVVEEANRMVAELKAAEAAAATTDNVNMPTVSYAHNDTIDLLNMLKRAVIDKPELITARATQLTPQQLAALTKAQKAVRNRFREFAEAASVFGDKMSTFVMLDTTGQNWVQTLMSIPFPFHTFQTGTFRTLMERMMTQPAVRRALMTESKMFEHYNGDASQEYITVRIGGVEYRIYASLGKYMMNMSDYFNVYRYGDTSDEGGLLTGIIQFGNMIGASPYPFVDIPWRYNRGQTPYYKGYLPQSRALYNIGLAMFGKSVPAWLLEDRDIGYITNELGIMAQEKMITDVEAQYAAGVLRHLRNPEQPIPEFMREDYAAYANILNTAMQRVGQRGTVSALTQYFTGVTVAPRAAEQTGLEQAKEQYRNVSWPENKAGGRTAQQAVATANPGIYVSFTRYNIDDPTSENPAMSARRQEYYDKADVIFGQMAQAVIDKLAESPTAKTSAINDVKRPFWNQIEELKAEYKDALDMKFERNLAKMNPSERAVYELEALLRYDGEKPGLPADDATPEEKVAAYEARAAWEVARLDHIERNIRQLSAEDSIDAWKQKLVGFVTDEYASELVRKYLELKYAGKEEKEWSALASVIDERRDAAWDERYKAVADRMGKDALRAAKVYSQIGSEEERKKFREEHPELVEAWTAMYRTADYDATIAKFGKNVWDTYRDYKDALPEYPGQDASDSAKAKYYDELEKVNAEYEDGYEIRLWIDGRWRWWYDEEGSFDESGKFGGDYQEAIALFGADIFDLYTSPEGYKNKRVQAFNEWRNEYQERAAGSAPPPAVGPDPFLRETETEYDPNEFNANYYGPRPVGSDRTPVVGTQAGAWDAAINEWRDKGQLTPQEFFQAWQAAGNDEAAQKRLLESHPQYAKVVEEYEKAKGNPGVLDAKRYFDAADANSRSSGRRYGGSSRRYYSGGSGRRYYSGGGGGGGQYWDGGNYQPMFQPQGVSSQIRRGLEVLERQDGMDSSLWSSVLKRYERLR